MSTKEQSATLLRLNKQEQVTALQAVGFADITANSRASEFPNRIKWAAGLLDMRVACNRISDNSKWYFTREEWNSLTPANKLKFIRRGLCIRSPLSSLHRNVMQGTCPPVSIGAVLVKRSTGFPQRCWAKCTPASPGKRIHT